MTDNSIFELSYLEEPEVHFREGSDVSPKRGLTDYGPILKDNQHKAINVGAIGDTESIRLLNELFLDMTGVIHPDLGGDSIRPWRVPYPGLHERSELDISIAFRERWKARMISGDMEAILAHDSIYERFDAFLEYIREEIDWLASDDPTPDVIVVCIPEQVLDGLRDTEAGDVIVGGRNLHSQIKITGMEEKIPTQLIKPDTLRTTTAQDKATKAWNLTVGMLYKAQRGHPWKTKKLDHGTCYAGISFYEDRSTDGNVLRAALAHVFARKDYNIIQSEPLENISEDENGQPHLSKEAAANLSEQIVEYYQKRNRGAKPERLVIHKTSPYWDGEREGFRTGASDVRMHDYVHLKTRRTGVRLFPDGEYPPLRGTLLSIPSDDVHYLYTTGYVPEVATYEGSNIPEPIEIRPDIQCDSDAQTICEEILFLTKLDWNTSDFAVKEPITLKVARKVSDVIADEGINPVDADKQYFYYM